MFVSAQGSPYPRFRRALATRNLDVIRAAAAELPSVRLDDALEICVVLRDAAPERYERAAVRWLARFAVERADATVERIEQAAHAFALMRTAPEAALADLQAICGRS